MSATIKLSSEYETLPDPYSLPLDALDVSDPRLAEQDKWAPYFKRLRDEDPVHFHERSAFGPFWSVTRYQDVTEVETKYETYSSLEGIFIPDEPAEIKLRTFLHLPPPEHTRQRMAVMPTVAPKNLARLQVLIRNNTMACLDGLPIGETFDWVEHVAVELTLRMVATLFDFPFEERHKLLYWTSIAGGAEGLTGEGSVTLEERQAGAMEMLERFTRLWHERAAAIAADPKQADDIDLLTKLIINEHTKDLVNRPTEFIGNLFLLITGGNDTTRNSMSGSIVALNDFPQEFQKLRENPDLIKSMVPEIIRWQTPFACMRRTATEDATLGGKTIRRGDKVVMWYVSANRDATAIDRPDQFIIDREKPHQHLSFGYGIHRCMGSRLAELQLTILWQEMLKRFETVEVVGKPQRLKSYMIRGFTELPVRLKAKATRQV